MTENKSSTTTSDILLTAGIHTVGFLVIGLILSLVNAKYIEYRDRIDTLESTAIAQAQWQTNPNASIVGKDMGFFSNGYKLTIKDKDRQFDLYVTPEEYLAAQPGQKTCVRYKLLKDKVKGAHLCGESTGENP